MHLVARTRLGAEQRLGLPDPVFARDAAEELEVVVEPKNLRRREHCDLVVMIDAERVEHAFVLGSDATDAPEIVGAAVARTGQAGRTLARRIRGRGPRHAGRGPQRLLGARLGDGEVALAARTYTLG